MEPISHPADRLDDLLGRLADDPAAAAGLTPDEAAAMLDRLRSDLGLAPDYAPRPR